MPAAMRRQATDNPGISISRNMRIDRWLWCVRFFKTRNLATRAVKGKRVTVNGQSVKPAREIAVGEKVLISQQDGQVEVVVTSIPQRRGPYKEACSSYEETEDSIAGRQARRTQPGNQIRVKRPDARGRRRLRQLKRVDSI
jgi:ribosome-associated heat shock protein Hsp15